MKKIIALLLILTMLTACGGKANSFDAKILAKINIVGFNGKGKATVSRDESNVMTLLKEIEKEKGSQEAMRIAMILERLDFEVESSEQDSLSNGDDIKIKASYPMDDAKKEKINFTNLEYTYTIAGLKDAIEVDPFAEIELVYEGISPSARVTIANRSEKQFVHALEYKCTPYKSLRIGDKVTVTVETSKEAAEKQGYILPDTLTKEYTVEGIDEYLQSFDDLDNETKDKMKKESKDLVESKMASDHYLGTKANFGMNSPDTKIDTPELYKIYFNKIKPDGKGDSANDIFYVYKISATILGEAEPKVGYMAVRFVDAIKNDDGKISLDISKGELWYHSISSDWEKTYETVAMSQKANYEVYEITP